MYVLLTQKIHCVQAYVRVVLSKNLMVSIDYYSVLLRFHQPSQL